MTRNNSYHDDGVAPKGYIKIARKTFEMDPWWLERRTFSRWEAWVDVIQLAAFKTHPYRTERGVITLARGEFVASLRFLSTRWNWTVKRVRTWLAQGAKGARLRAQRETPAGTVYLVVNYDVYQRDGYRIVEAKGTPTDRAKAQQGHKTETGIEGETEHPLIDRDDELLVLDHYLATHPGRRVGAKDATTVRRALRDGYSPTELCDAITGNADDDWHRERQKHELSYTLRDHGNIDRFRARSAQLGDELIVDGWMSPQLERATRPSIPAR